MWMCSLLFMLVASGSLGLAISVLFWGSPELSIAFGVISIATVSLYQFLTKGVNQ